MAAPRRRRQRAADGQGSRQHPDHRQAERRGLVDGRVVDVRAVRANVERLHAREARRGVLVIAEQDAPTGVLVAGDRPGPPGRRRQHLLRHAVELSACARNATARPTSEDHGIDLAPMLDFVLNLLIFFIITTSFVNEAGVDRRRAPRPRPRSTRDGQHPDRDPRERRDLDGPPPGRPARGARPRSSACTSSGPTTPSSMIADKAAQAGVLAR